MMTKLLYQPSEAVIQKTALYSFAKHFAHMIGEDETLLQHSYLELHKASVKHADVFWNCLWNFAGILGTKGDLARTQETHIQKTKFFPQAQLNYAENLLARFQDADQMMVFSSEGKNERRFTALQVKQAVASLQNYLKKIGIGKGDIVVGVMPNVPETVIIMLAVTGLGGVWASCSPDFGANSIMDRFGQIHPKAIFICDSYRYNNKMQLMHDKIEDLHHRLPNADMVIVPFIPHQPLLAEQTSLHHYEDILNHFSSNALTFTPCRFNDPLFILFSSGTTGVPKCIIHSVGGTLLQHRKEHLLHCNLSQSDKFFYYTTCGWMMWNWAVSSLAGGMCLVLYDGSPFAPHPNILWDYTCHEKVSFFGTSAKYLDALRKFDVKPSATHDVSSLNMIASTGSPLSPEGFDYVYEFIKPDLHLASISGGTDIVSCFMLGVPTLPVYSGQLQGAGLGMDVIIVDSAGKDLTGEQVCDKGELVCKNAFPCMPIGFWHDTDGSKYFKAYFDRFDNMWVHGDFAGRTPEGGFIIYGRSDAILNPGGVRIGTAEIYRQVEKLDEVLESVCVGQEWQDDVRVVLFVKLREHLTLSEDLVQKIKSEIKNGTTPRHVPAVIKQVVDIPRTISGKITEIAVRDVIHGREVKNTGALANPESLAYYRNIV